MKKLAAAVFAIAASLNIMAQTVTVSPLPQKITWGEKAFDKGTQVKMTTGVVKDKKVKAYKKLVPTQAESYYLKVTPSEVIVAGRDSAGLFYGMQTLSQIMSKPEVMQCEVTDYPSVECRGVIEGFYGNPWSHADRLRQLDFYGQQKMNIYVYGPKDDPWHRDRWREPYPAEQAGKIHELVERARQNHVQFVWAIHPGVDIKWVKEDSVNVVNKLESMYKLGVRTFAVFFDDIWGEGAKGDKQAGLLNYVTDNFVRKHKDVQPLIMCPTQYNKGWSHGDYLSTLGTQMYPEVRIMWTGNSVVDMIEEDDMQWINDQIKRKAFIWLNYPVNDYCQSRLLMGKTYGNGLNINDMVSGFCSNPMEYAEASKVSLYSIADYTWNMPQYNSVESWRRAIAHLMPTSKEAFEIFCRNNVDLGVTGHGLRREGESADFAKLPTDGARTNYCLILTAMAEQLLADSVNQPEMLNEIRPWVESMALLGQRGSQIAMMTAALQQGDSVAFIGHYKAQAAIEQAQKAIISRNYEGSIVKAKPIVSGDVITPWVVDKVAALVKEYKKKYTYGLDAFPVQILPDGEYFIKVNGEYLTDTNAGADNVGDYPTFQTERDVINPQRQQWLVEQDAKNGRYKITNKQDGRYINELGNFWRSKANPYSADWNTYNLTKDKDGKFAIQNDGSAGKNYWQREADRIQSNSSEPKYVFEFVPVK